MGCTYLFSGDTWGSLHAALQTCSRGLLPLWSDDLGQARARALRPAECTVLACRHDLLPVLPTPSRKAVPQQRMHLGDPVRAPPPLAPSGPPLAPSVSQPLTPRGIALLCLRVLRRDHPLLRKTRELPGRRAGGANGGSRFFANLF